MKSSTESNKETICQKAFVVFSILFYIIAILSFVGGTIYHIYLTIAGLTGLSNSDIRSTCNMSAVNNTSLNNTIEYTYIGETPSQIWMYSLFSCFFVNMYLFKLISNISETDSRRPDYMSQIICGINCSGVLYASFCAWGWDQLYNSGTCLEYNFGKFDTHSWGWELMTSSYISFYFQLFICIIIACLNMCMCAIVSYISFYFQLFICIIIACLNMCMCAIISYDSSFNKNKPISSLETNTSLPEDTSLATNTSSTYTPDVHLIKVVTGDGDVIVNTNKN